MTLGERIKQERKALNWTQTKLAKEAGCHQQMISRLENNQAKMTGDILGIALALNVSVEWLLSGNGPKERHEYARQMISSFPRPTQAEIALEIHRRLALNAPAESDQE